MASVFSKNVLRSIRGSLGRFVAIAAIVALGCGFYAGLRMTAPDMKQAADEFFDGSALMDIRVVSPLGLTEDDVEAIRSLDGVSGAMGAYETDAVALVDERQYVVRIHSIPPACADSSSPDGRSAASDDADYLNRPVLLEGRWPENAGECVMAGTVPRSESMAIGDTVQLQEGVQDLDEVLDETSYTIVGFVNSSYYATSASLGSTSLSTGVVQEYMYVPEGDFNDDLPFTEVFVTVAAAAGEESLTAPYDDAVQRVVDEIKAIAPECEQRRLDEVRAQAQEELDEAKETLERERADAEAQLADAAAQLDDARAQLADGRAQLADGQARFDEGQQQLEEGSGQLDDARAQYEEGRTQYEEGTAQLQAAQEEYNAGVAQYNAAEESYTQGINAYQDAAWELEQNRSQIDQLREAIPGLQAAADAGDEAASAQLAEARAAVEAFDSSEAQINATKAQLDAARAELDQRRSQLQEARTQIEASEQALRESHEQLSDALDTIDQSQGKLDESQGQLDESRSQLSGSADELASAQAAIDEGQAEYDARKAEADEKLADAQAEIDDAQERIDELELPEWIVLDRSSNYGVAAFDADADRIDSIASVFPLIFFLVAALVALTTMTRMVEDDRMLIGTFKALGYSKRRIAWKYVAYGLLASVIGCVVGVLVLSQLLPLVIMTAYGIVYFVPQPPFPLPIDPLIAGLSAAFGIGVTLVATAAAAWVVLAERPAALMLPPAPKAGRRILLERVSPAWKRLSFSWKVTLRNMFRYKKRLFMTIVGIAGCTALLLTGLGISDAINDIINKQFGELTKYNLIVTLDEDASGDDVDAVDALLADDSAVEDAAAVLDEPMLASGPDATDVRLNLVVPEDPDGFAGFFTLRNRLSQEALTLGQDGCLVSEKLAQVCGVVAGDSLTLTEQDSAGNPTSATYRVPVTGIVENYIGYDVFMGPDLYEETFGKPAEYSTRFVIASDNASAREELLDRLQEAEAVKTAAFNDETIETYRSMLASVNLIVVVLVVSAALLAFIVLYNLTNINISERSREIATLKVLGFLPRETNAYIFREIFLLAAIGALVGLVLGVGLESFVVLTAEVDGVMFGRQIHLLSFVLAFVLTMVFTWVSMLAMKPKIARIDMVESLKSNE